MKKTARGIQKNMGKRMRSVFYTLAALAMVAQPFSFFGPNGFSWQSREAQALLPEVVYVDDGFVSELAAVLAGHVLGVDAFASLQDALDAVEAGGVVQVAAGTYSETVTVTKAVTFKGAKFGLDARNRSGAESIMNNPAGAFVVAADGVVIDGFTITGTTVSGGGALILSREHSGYQIKNNVIYGNTYGMMLASGGDLATTISQNYFYDNNKSDADAGYAIYAGQGASNVVISDNAITGHDNVSIHILTGLEANTDLVVTDNLITDAPVKLDYVDGLSITGNTCEDSYSSCFELTDASNASVTGNTFDNVGDGGMALAFFATMLSENVTVEDNDFTDSNSGNDGEYGDTALHVSSSASALTFAVSQNRVDGFLKGMANDAPDNIDAEENWWGDASGPSGEGPGTGASVSGNTLFAPWCLAADCLTLSGN